MTASAAYPDKTAVTDLLGDGGIVLNRCPEVDFQTRKVKCESSFTITSQQIPPNNITSNLIQSVKIEPDFPRSDETISSGWSNDLAVKIKEEKDDKEGITHELVEFLPRSSDDIKDSIFKTETGDESSGDEKFWDNGNCHDPSLSGGDESVCGETSEKHCTDPRTVPRHYCAAKRRKLAYVSVELEDIFSMNDRKLGKAHTNIGVCSCIYCRGEWKYVSDLQRVCANPQKGKRSTWTKSCEKLEESETREETQKGKKLVQCTQCSFKCQHNYSLKLHMRVHTGEKPFRCHACAAVFTQSSGLNTHMKSVHSNKRPFGCKLCSATFKQGGTLSTHMRAVHSDERPFSCNLCPLTFKLKGNLKIHMEGTHMNKIKACCKLCSATFKLNETLRTHMACVHSNKRPFKCKICSATFKLKSHLTKHETMHSSERPFKCDSCPAAFRLLQLLKEHWVIHSDERPYKCEICPGTFKLKSHLAAHTLRHGAARPFKCPQCPMTFKLRGLIRVHVRQVHNTERPFKCKHCPASFKTLSLSKIHMRQVHCTERPYKCEECSATFKTKSVLGTHIGLHNGNRRFKCALCQAKFKLKGNLTTHLKSHDKGKAT